MLKSHPEYDNAAKNAPVHTFVKESNMLNSENKKAKKLWNKVLRQRILTTCGDASCTQQNKHVNLALFVFVGCMVIFTGDNVHLKLLFHAETELVVR